MFSLHGTAYAVYRGDLMKMSRLFARCLEVPYLQAAESASYYIERKGAILYIYLQASNGIEDWKNNLDFPARPYHGGSWMAHRGFVRVWKALEPYVANAIADPRLQGVVTVGYSHGGALAVLCHEYVYYHRPDLRKQIESFAFGAPRVLWGVLSPVVRQRWEKLTLVRNLDDLITHLPPRVLGYTHVGALLEIGNAGSYSRIDAHRSENIMRELLRKDL